ncbi:glyoxalase/bleomycin resistance protein/dioxygenase superfamily protein [Chitinophaga skermanii]|uniref:Glyoxalase/bleomycin resistance protein/dioxygenase superfamily protein n=1 Tax=Chitinophaga skermanii TaxID=331697 RepID=A0A327Q429_9BACT|nr:VOC family protein [Chitinophaga skermanii]RAI98674.1 glyoxalase/bleomycin resistance protein/dioxygenase superfamily protein [Chitinophaga skermanii]
MQITLGRVVILVHDYDDALDFYSKVLNARILFQQTTETGQRFLHIGFDDRHLGIWFLLAEDETQKQLVGQQTGDQPALVMYTNDMQAFLTLLDEYQVKIIRPLKSDPSSQYIHFADLYGNEIIMVQLN